MKNTNTIYTTPLPLVSKHQQREGAQVELLQEAHHHDAPTNTLQLSGRRHGSLTTLEKNLLGEVVPYQVEWARPALYRVDNIMPCHKFCPSAGSNEIFCPL